MKKTISTLALAITLAAFPFKKSEAVVGLVLWNPTVMTVGGILTGVSGVSLLTLGDHDYGRGALSGLGFIAGIIVLNGTEASEIAFAPVAEGSKLHARFTAKEIDTYNSEVEELNAVRESVLQEVARDPKASVPELWAQHGATLSAETLKVADFNGKVLVRSLK